MQELTKLATVNRVEVIDWTDDAEIGRAFVKWIKRNMSVEYQLQDDGRTLKIFLREEK